MTDTINGGYREQLDALIDQAQSEIERLNKSNKYLADQVAALETELQAEKANEPPAPAVSAPSSPASTAALAGGAVDIAGVRADIDAALERIAANAISSSGGALERLQAAKEKLGGA